MDYAINDTIIGGFHNRQPDLQTLTCRELSRCLRACDDFTHKSLAVRVGDIRDQETYDMSVFNFVDRVRYEGPEVQSAFAFRHYYAERVLLG